MDFRQGNATRRLISFLITDGCEKQTARLFIVNLSYLCHSSFLKLYCQRNYLSVEGEMANRSLKRTGVSRGLSFIAERSRSRKSKARLFIL